jgi:hypothetical protein
LNFYIGVLRIATKLMKLKIKYACSQINKITKPSNYNLEYPNYQNVPIPQKVVGIFFAQILRSNKGAGIDIS